MRVVAALLLAAAAVAAAAPSTVVRTLDGPVEGYLTSEARVFRGIPFATPPEGKLRWRNPFPAQAWSGVRDATKDAPGCWQKCELPNPDTCPPTMSEDCLYLNVFTPLEAAASPAAVLVFFHGGNYKQGYAGGPLYNGEAIAKETGTIVVVTQYRLGALGFLHNNGSITGNYGLADQRLALQWVQQNIAAFGGDPTHVTLQGQSAGAMSIAAHMLNPECEGLFAAAIMESEPFGLHYRTVPEAHSFAETFMKDAHCQDEACLFGTAPADLIAAQVQAEHDILGDITSLMSVFLPWTPTAGYDFLTAQPITMWQEGKAMDIPFVIGTTQNEAWLFIYSGFGKPLSELEYKLILDFALPFGGTTKVLKQYPIPDSMKDDVRPIASEVVTHGMFKCATRNATLSHIEATDSAPFVYHFDHVMSFSKFAWGPATFCDDKVCHGEELPFVFYPNVTAWGVSSNVSFTPAEDTLSHTLAHYWANFAANHNPGTGFSGAPLAWPQYTPNTQQTMTFQTPANAVAEHAWADICSFWDNEIGYVWP